MAPFEVTEVTRTSASQAVQAQLLELIQSGHIPVGEKLPSEIKLAQSFGVSRPVVREALGSLRAMGFVSSRSGSGTFVTSAEPVGPAFSLLGRCSTDDLYEVRSHLEVPGAGLAATRRTHQQLARLRTIVALQQECTDPVEWAKLDVSFHAVLAGATQNSVHSELVVSLRNLQREQSTAVLRVEGRMHRAMLEHEEILLAISDSDAPRARKAMHDHLTKISMESRLLTGTTTTSPPSRQSDV